MKKIFVIVITCISIVLVTSCGSPMGNRLNLLGEIVNSDDKEAEETMEQVFGYLKNKDADGLKTLYSENLLNVENVDGKTEDLINFFEGDILTYRNDGGTGSARTTEKGTKAKWELMSPWIIETSSGNYELFIRETKIDDKNPKSIGINCIMLSEEDVSLCIPWSKITKDYENEHRPIIDIYVENRDSLTLLYDGDSVQFVDEIINKDGVVYYPFGILLRVMATDFECDDESGIGTANLNGISIEFKAGEENYIVNGQSIYMNGASAFIENEMLYIPIKYLMEGFGFNVLWDKATKSIIIE